MPKRITALLLALLLLCGVTACAGKQTTVEQADEQATEENENATVFSREGKVMDIYFIAGQSNAIGHTKISDRAAAYAWAPELENGYTNVLTAGLSRWDTADGNYTTRRYDWQKTTLDLGVSASGKIGPEAGMAKALSAYYNSESGRTAGLIKYGHGGTSLLTEVTDSTTGSNRFGTWVSPSYASRLGLNKYQYQGGKTGALYREFLKVIREQLTALAAEGYTNVNIKGLYWMQGENDREKPDAYKTAFRLFASDIRRDIAEIVRELTGGDDRGAADMPIYVGTISQTQNLNHAGAEAKNLAFIAMQKKLPEEVTNCYVVDNSGFVISRYDAERNTVDATGLGSDQWHWNQQDQLTIGYNVGQAMLARS